MTRRRRADIRTWTTAGVPWLLAYGTLQAYWAAGNRPAELSPVGEDLVVFGGRGMAAVCAVGALLLLGMAATRGTCAGRRILLPAAWAVSLAMVAAGAMLLLDVVGGILPGLGIEFFPLGALSRAASVGGGVVVGLAALSYRRAALAGCAECGRPETAPGPLERTPTWAYVAAYGAVAGCAVRVAAQAVVGLDENPLASGASMILFEAGFLLGGGLLPLTLVHAWGRVWPRWVPGLAGRAVPRRPVLWPATAISGGLTVYFGLMLLQMISERLQGRNPFPPSGGLELPEAFFWVAVPAYLLWGAGMAVAAVAYARRTRTGCHRCGR